MLGSEKGTKFLSFAITGAQLCPSKTGTSSNPSAMEIYRPWETPLFVRNAQKVPQLLARASYPATGLSVYLPPTFHLEMGCGAGQLAIMSPRMATGWWARFRRYQYGAWLSLLFFLVTRFAEFSGSQEGQNADVFRSRTHPAQCNRRSRWAAGTRKTQISGTMRPEASSWLSGASVGSRLQGQCTLDGATSM